MGNFQTNDVEAVQFAIVLLIHCSKADDKAILEVQI